jgi:hypothetical protein
LVQLLSGVIPLFRHAGSRRACRRPPPQAVPPARASMSHAPVKPPPATVALSVQPGCFFSAGGWPAPDAVAPHGDARRARAGAAGSVKRAESEAAAMARYGAREEDGGARLFDARPAFLCHVSTANRRRRETTKSQP